MGVPRKSSTYAETIASPAFFSTRSPLFFGEGIVRYTPMKSPMKSPISVPATAIAIV